MQGENIFRFLNVRPAAPAKLTGTSGIQFDPYSVIDKKTDLYQKLKTASAEEIKTAARSFQRSAIFRETIGDHPGLTHLHTWAFGARLLSAVQFFKSEDFAKHTDAAANEYIALADSLLSIAILGNSRKRNSDELGSVLKLLYLRFAKSIPENETESLGHYLGRLTIVFPQWSTHPPVKKNSDASTRPRASKDNITGSSAVELESAYNEISRLVSSAIPQVVKTKFSSEKSSARSGTKENESIGSSLSANGIGDLRIPASRVTASTLSVLRKMKADVYNTDPFGILSLLERELTNLTSSQPAQKEYGLLRIGNLYFDTAKLYSGTNSLENTGDASQKCSIVAGIGDLLLIRQKLKGYRLSEIAHVENVLKGEKRERNHRRLNRLTEDFFSSAETEKTKERELETTERNEMQSQISSTATTELGLNFGVQVSGSYGPTMSFDSQLDSSFSTTTEESQQKAVNFSRSLSEKTSEKIREITKRERRTTSVEEVEEVNAHKFENGQDNNITGVYRWLDKIYDAQVLNYGQRMMLDIVLPEPAAFYLFSLVKSPPEGTVLIKPEAPSYGNAPLAPGNISRFNYQDYIRKYGVTGVPEPPPQFITVSYNDSKDGSAKDDYARSSKIPLPDKYEAYAASVANDTSLASTGSPHARIYIGDGVFTVIGGWQYAGFSRKREKEIAVAVHYRNAFNFSLGVDVYCELTKEGMTAWQHKVYDVIMEAYRNQLAEYEEKLATASIQRGTNNAPGSDPATNATVIQEELRKLCIQLLSKHNAPGLDSFQSGEPPLIDTEKTCDHGSIIRFFEHAFEWNNLAYVMYPYFWGRKVRWADAIQLTGSDNSFTAFLKAGATRVQLAVRPGFESVVAYYLQSGIIWEGNNPPLMNDQIYVPIIQEITENLGALEDGVVYPQGAEPWEVNLPTSLVYLQKDVPVFEDPLQN